MVSVSSDLCYGSLTIIFQNLQIENETLDQIDHDNILIILAYLVKESMLQTLDKMAFL